MSTSPSTSEADSVTAAVNGSAEAALPKGLAEQLLAAAKAQRVLTGLVGCLPG